MAVSGVLGAINALVTVENLSFALFGALIAMILVLVAVGLWRGSWVAKLGAVLLGTLWTISGLAHLGTNPGWALAQLALSIMIVVLVLFPRSSRRWFTQQ